MYNYHMCIYICINHGNIYMYAHKMYTCIHTPRRPAGSPTTHHSACAAVIAQQLFRLTDFLKKISSLLDFLCTITAGW